MAQTDDAALVALERAALVALDRAALVAIYNATDGTRWTRRGNWDTNEPLRTWAGVTVHDEGPEEGRVKDLYLIGNRLRGSIPPKLGDLGALESLNLSSNHLIGSIPSKLGDLGALKSLNLSSNHLIGRIPKELGKLAKLETLRLSPNKAHNKLTGPIPKEWKKLPDFETFKIGLSVDGRPLPPVPSSDEAKKMLYLPVFLGYADLASDVYTALEYYRSNHLVWFGLGLVFALGPALIAVFFLAGFKWYRRVFVATHLGLFYEAYRTVDEAEDQGYSPVLALVRVVEPLFESVPQLLLQLYVMLTIWIETSSSPGRLGGRVLSVLISALSLAYAATDIASVERLIKDTAVEPNPTPGRTSFTGHVFSRVPEEGPLSPISGFGYSSVHPRRHVWICFVYHVFEIGCRFVSLAMALTVIRKWFFLLILYLWGSRGVIVLTAAACSKKNLAAVLVKAREVRFRTRLVAIPFLDSMMDGRWKFKLALILTFVEFILCLIVYLAYTQDDLSASERLAWTLFASVCMVAKMCLAGVAIIPLVERGHGSRGQEDGTVRSEQRIAVADEPETVSAEFRVIGSPENGSGVHERVREFGGPVRGR